VSSVVHGAASSKCAATSSSVLLRQENVFGSRNDPEQRKVTNLQTYRLVDQYSRTWRFTRREVSRLELKQTKHFEDDDDNDNNSDDVEDVSVHGSCITRHYRQRQARLCDCFSSRPAVPGVIRKQSRNINNSTGKI
jgi:hypothetical protein